MDKLISFFDSQLIYALGWTIIHSFWQSLLVLGLLSVSLVINKNSRPETRYWLALIAMFCCFIISIKTFIYCKQDIVQASLMFEQLQGFSFNEASSSTWGSIFQTINPWLDTIVLVWFLGFCLQAARCILDILISQYLKQTSISPISHEWNNIFSALVKKVNIQKQITFLQSSKVQVPCVIGHLKPVILIPLGMLTQLSVSQVEAIILHELAHIKRHDYLFNTFQSVLKVIFFFNPAVLAMSKKVDIERENACDDIAVETCGDPLLFANSLSQFANVTANNTSLLAANKDSNQLLVRVQRLFSTEKKFSNLIEKMCALVSVGIITLSLNLHAATPVKTAVVSPKNMQQVDVNIKPQLQTKSTQSLEPGSNPLMKTSGPQELKSQTPAPKFVAKFNATQLITKAPDEYVKQSLEPISTTFVNPSVVPELNHKTPEPKTPTQSDTLPQQDIVAKLESPQIAAHSAHETVNNLKHRASLNYLQQEEAPKAPVISCGRLTSTTLIPRGGYAVPIGKHNGKRLHFLKQGGIGVSLIESSGFISLNLSPGLHTFTGFAVCTSSSCEFSRMLGGTEADEVKFNINVEAGRKYKVFALPAKPRSLKPGKRFTAIVKSSPLEECKGPKPKLSLTTIPTTSQLAEAKPSKTMITS
ncbi:M56 family metallopeptidase [Paraglaciecola sp.]|uniref:M56 family metallopeptidase n=1 Tax=Paraglaciecola sp. TaxID=1920173 RepID=UPI003EF0FAB1